MPLITYIYRYLINKHRYMYMIFSCFPFNCVFCLYILEKRLNKKKIYLLIYPLILKEIHCIYTFMRPIETNCV